MKQMERHEIEMNKREQDEANRNIAWTSFREYAVDMVADCLKEDGDLLDLINDLDLEYDQYDSLENKDINAIICDAVKKGN